MQTLIHRDLQHVVRHIPKDVRDLMTSNPGLFIGGGFIREIIAGGAPKDIDFFGASKLQLRGAAELMATGRKGRVHSTDNAFTVIAPPRMPLQFITRWLYTEPAEVLKSFDFTVCQAVVWHDGLGQWVSTCADAFYPDLAARRLVYTFPQRNEDAGGSLMRVVKFLRRGTWNIQVESLAGVTGRLLSDVRMSGLATASEQGRAKVIHGLLREVDPLTLVDGLDPVDEEADEQP